MSYPSASLAARSTEEVHVVDREQMLEVTLQQIEKQHGKGAVMRLGEHAGVNGIGMIPTGSLALDIALGIGGIPRGRIVEVYGPEGSGKTTVCLHVIAEAQAKGGITAFIDAEHALDPTYARTLGVNIDELLVSQPDSGEQALEIADLLVRSGAVDLIVIDSVAALVPRAEIEIMFGNPETTPGGRALKFYSSVRLDVRKIDNLKDGTEVVGSRVRAKVVKNKLAPPFRQAEFDIIYGKGVSKEGSLLDVGVDTEIVQKSGAWFTYEVEQLGQGRENSRQFLAEHKDIAGEIERKIREVVGLTSFSEEDDRPVDIPDQPADQTAAAVPETAKAKAGAGQPISAPERPP